MNTSKVAVIASSILGKFLSIIGYVFGAMFLLAICFGDYSAEGAAAGVTLSVILLVLCLFAIIKGAQIKHRIKRFKSYVGLISNEHMTSLENLASSTTQSIDFVRKDIQKMIDKKFFANAYIDRKTNEIIIGGMRVQPQVTMNYQSQQNTVYENESVKCQGCGAINLKQKGVSSSCEYCGSPLK